MFQYPSQTTHQIAHDRQQEILQAAENDRLARAPRRLQRINPFRFFAQSRQVGAMIAPQPEPRQRMA